MGKAKKTKGFEEIDALVRPLAEYCKKKDFTLVIGVADKKGKGPGVLQGTPHNIHMVIKTLNHNLTKSIVEEFIKGE